MVSVCEIISEEYIKPSSPTPQHLKLYNLSILDQLIPAPYAPIILYYQNQDHASEFDIQERLNVLKNSLSNTLTRFYPLAGTIKDDVSIDCNDVGAYFAVASVNTKLDEFLTRPDLELINHFLPHEPTINGSSDGLCVSNVQVTIFKCCGIAISLCISHKVLDGAALSTFLNSWAGTSFGSKEVVYPNMNASSIFPAKDLWLKDTSMVMFGSKFKMGKCSTTRFVFDTSKLAILKAKAAENGSKDPTRVEVVTALLWKCIMAASEENSGSWKPSLLSHVVNLRKRLVSSLSEHSIGNLIWLASAECKTKAQTGLLQDLVEKVRGSVSKINSEFVKKLQGEKRTKVMEESLKSIKDCVDYTGVTSWCKMGFYEVDFGWGKPIWVCGSVFEGSPVFMNFIILMDTKNGDGIEAWVNIDEHEMNIMKHNMELLEFAFVDPSPLKINYQ
uniref:stemmadenine O-acetyltransferase-like n=1 Tax=Erigeron canadensis TaxID=72917 RepID=UPI001CB8925F|nr:stemmadenine O-acetyltransferase-like [Erigeron canadensis]